MVGWTVAPVAAFVYHQFMRGPETNEIIIGVIRLTILVMLGFGVHRLARRVRLPVRGSRLRFATIHTAAATVAITLMYHLSHWFNRLIFGVPGDARPEEFGLIGAYLYIVIAGVSYAVEERARAARAEAAAAQMQLAALRSQIQPHFLFNALHTVVQLIPIDPNRAMDAAEMVAGMLRTTMEEQRDIVPLAHEWDFVSRYIELEKIRFGDRLRIRADVDPSLMDARVPSYALQTLVENAVIHGAAPRIEPTDIVVGVTGNSREVTLSVRNLTNGGSGNTAGTGLKRLGERLHALYGNSARLTYGLRDDGAFDALVVLPRVSQA